MLPLAMGVGRFAMQALPYLTAAGAALPSLKEGKPLEAAVQGGLGFLTGGAVKGGLGRLTQAAAGRAGQAAAGLQTAAGQLGGLGAQKAVAPFLTAKNLRMAAQVGVPLAGVAAVPVIAKSVAGGASEAQQAARTAAQVAAGTAGYQAPGAVDYESIAGGALPPDIGTFGAGGTLSDPLNVLGRVGMAQRLETMKTAEAQRDALRLMMPEIAKATEFRSRQELQRNLAAAGVRQNILTAANMLERSQQAAQQMGLTAASQAGAALTQQYQYQ